MSELARFYIGLPYPVAVREDRTTDGGVCFVALHPDLRGCMSHGASVGEAVANLAEAKRLFIETMLESGLSPAPPSAAVEDLLTEPMASSDSSKGIVVRWQVKRAATKRLESKTGSSRGYSKIIPTETVTAP